MRKLLTYAECHIHCETVFGPENNCRRMVRKVLMWAGVVKKGCQEVEFDFFYSLIEFGRMGEKRESMKEGKI